MSLALHLIFSIFLANPLGTGTFAIKRGNNGTTLFTGSLPVPVASTPIPTPALLPGLVALGVATLKKRRGIASDSEAQSTQA